LIEENIHISWIFDWTDTKGNILSLKITNVVIYVSTNHDKEKNFADQRLQENLQMIEATMHYIWISNCWMVEKERSDNSYMKEISRTFGWRKEKVLKIC